MLNGMISGKKTHKEAVAAAKQSAALYYGEDVRCIKIKVLSEVIASNGLANMAYEGFVWHQLDKPAYGFARCTFCNKQNHSKGSINTKEEYE